MLHDARLRPRRSASTLEQRPLALGARLSPVLPLLLLAGALLLRGT